MDQWRIVVLGEDGIGKTALAIQFALNSFSGVVQEYDPTIEDECQRQLVIDDRMCLVDVFDSTIGQEGYGPLQDRFIREGQGFILAYSITSRPTFDSLETFHQAMRRVKGGDPIFVLVGNKCDKESEREVRREAGPALAQQYGCEFLETSAKTAHNVDRAFMSVVRALRDAASGNHGSLEAASGNHGSPETKKKRKRKCIIL
ncbi:ras protein [Mycena capillaripes]|nr:ras protein [Mycena capillaripes]